MKRLFIVLILSVNYCFLIAQTNNLLLPERIILNLTTNPSSEIAVTWRTIGEVSLPKVQYAESEQWIGFETKLSTNEAQKENVITDKGKLVYHYSSLIKNLKENTLYVYRVGGDSVWSEWIQFTTAKKDPQTFTFTFFGDPQNDLRDHCSRLFRQAFKMSPESQFWLFSGDLTSEPEDEQFSGFFFAGSPFFSMVPSVMAPGNHDIEFLYENGKVIKDNKGKKQRGTDVSNLWQAHFTLPENGPSGYPETSYSFDYQGVRFIMINSNDEEKLNIQAKWMEGLLQNNPNHWTIVSFHHPLYSAGRDRDDYDTRSAFLEIFDRYAVDLVLTGHDHAYARSKKIRNGALVADTEKGTVYVVSVSGPKMYTVNTNNNHIMAKTGGDVQLFQTISVSPEKLTYNSFTVNGVLFDSFELVK